MSYHMMHRNAYNECDPMAIGKTQAIATFFVNVAKKNTVITHIFCSVL